MLTCYKIPEKYIYISLRFGLANAINGYQRIKISVVCVENFEPVMLINCIRNTKPESIYFCIPKIFKMND